MTRACFALTMFLGSLVATLSAVGTANSQTGDSHLLNPEGFACPFSESEDAYCPYGQCFDACQFTHDSGRPQSEPAPAEEIETTPVTATPMIAEAVELFKADEETAAPAIEDAAEEATDAVIEDDFEDYEDYGYEDYDYSDYQYAEDYTYEDPSEEEASEVEASEADADVSSTEDPTAVAGDNDAPAEALENVDNTYTEEATPSTDVKEGETSEDAAGYGYSYEDYKDNVEEFDYDNVEAEDVNEEYSYDDFDYEEQYNYDYEAVEEPATEEVPAEQATVEPAMEEAAADSEEAEYGYSYEDYGYEGEYSYDDYDYEEEYNYEDGNAVDEVVEEDATEEAVEAEVVEAEVVEAEADDAATSEYEYSYEDDYEDDFNYDDYNYEDEYNYDYGYDYEQDYDNSGEVEAADEVEPESVEVEAVEVEAAESVEATPASSEVADFEYDYEGYVQEYGDNPFDVEPIYDVAPVTEAEVAGDEPPAPMVTGSLTDIVEEEATVEADTSEEDYGFTYDEEYGYSYEDDYGHAYEEDYGYESYPYEEAASNDVVEAATSEEAEVAPSCPAEAEVAETGSCEEATGECLRVDAIASPGLNPEHLSGAMIIDEVVSDAVEETAAAAEPAATVERR